MRKPTSRRKKLADVIGCLAVTLMTAGAGFVDIADEAEVNYLQWLPAPDTIRISPQVMTGGAAVADYDGDGWIDLFVTCYRDTDILFRNLGDGTFENVSQQAGITQLASSNGASWGDINNDGHPDLYITVADETANPIRNLLYINNGDGSFSEEAIQRGADLQTPHWHSGFSSCFGDYDRDGWLDIHTCQWSVIDQRNRSVLLKNTSAGGQFIDATSAAGVETWDDPELSGPPEFTTQAFTSRLTDVDGDAWPDLVVAGDFGTSRLFWNQGDGIFSDGTAPAAIGGEENGMGLAVGDYDGDGQTDLFFTSIFDARGVGPHSAGWGVTGNRLYRNLGNRTFADATDIAGVRDGGWGWGAVFFDYDNDGDLDLAMTNGFDNDRSATETPFHTDPTTLWRNDGGSFVDVSAAEGITHTGSGKGLLVFDFDKDGDLDLFIVNNSGTPTLYRNDLSSGNHWLRVKANGRYSNRDGIGARITILSEPGSHEQFREISGGSHYLSQSEPVAHFGLGATTTTVALVTVRWPSGIEQRFTDVAADQLLEITEPASPYEAWLAEHFTEAERLSGLLTAPDADPDADGFENALEFGGGLDPLSKQSLTPITAVRGDSPTDVVATYRRRDLPRGVDVTLEQSTDMETWQALPDGALEMISIEAEDDWGVETVSARVSGLDTQSAHFRLRVSIGS